MRYIVTPETKQLLFDGALLRIEKVACHRARRGLSCEECKSEHQIAVPLSGVNIRQVVGRTFAISPAHVTLSNRGEAYRVGHPYGSGETQLNFVLRDELLFEMLRAKNPHIDAHRERPFRERQIPADAKLHLAARLIAASAQSAAPVEVEESAIAFIDSILARAANLSGGEQPLSRDAKLAQRTRALLAMRFADDLTLDVLAATLDVSVYHLCRAFKRATGTTLWSQIQTLRARAALRSLQDGRARSHGTWPRARLFASQSLHGLISSRVGHDAFASASPVRKRINRASAGASAELARATS